MQAIYLDGWWMADRITGSDDHFLGLRFEPPAADLSGVDPRVVAVVTETVAAVNARLGTALLVTEIKLAPGERFSRGVYARLAELIATAAAG